MGREDYQQNSQSITPIFIFSLMNFVQKGVREKWAKEILWQHGSKTANAKNNQNGVKNCMILSTGVINMELNVIGKHARLYRANKNYYSLEAGTSYIWKYIRRKKIWLYYVIIGGLWDGVILIWQQTNVECVREALPRENWEKKSCITVVGSMALYYPWSNH